QDLDHAVRVQHDVLRFDVAVDDAESMRVLESGTELFHQPNLAADRQRCLPLHDGVECFSFDVFHRDERLVVVLADIEDGDNVGMLEAAGRSGLADETLAELFVVELLLEQLDRHQPIDTWIARQQNLAHPALGEPPEHLKPADVLWRFSHYRPATIAWTSR